MLRGSVLKPMKSKMQAHTPPCHALPRLAPPSHAIQKKKRLSNVVIKKPIAPKAESIWGIFANQTTIDHTDLQNKLKKWHEKYYAHRNEQLSLVLQHAYIEFCSDQLLLHSDNDYYHEHHITDTEWEEISLDNWDNVWNRKLGR